MSLDDVRERLVAHPRIATAAAGILLLLAQAQSALAQGAGGSLGP